MAHIKHFILLIILVFLTACGSVPIQQETKTRFNTTNNPELREISAVIISAGESLGWQMKQTSVSRIEAIKMSGNEKVIIDITHKLNSYKILYKSSMNMEYDAKKGQISRTYGRWIDELKNAINSKLSGM